MNARLLIVSAATLLPLMAPAATTTAPAPWPNGFRVDLTLVVGKAKHQPPMAVWVEDASGKYVTTLAVWSKKQNVKYLKAWAAASGGNLKDVVPVTGATRKAGEHRLIWNGRDKDNKPVPSGDYVVRIEHTLDGKKVFTHRGTIQCGAESASGKIDLQKDSKIDSVTITYGPAAAK